MQIRRCRGRRTVMSFRLCSRAPWTMSSSGIRMSIAGGADANACSPAVVPRPVVRVVDEARADGIVQHVAGRPLEVRIVPDHPCAEAVAEEVAVAAVAAVELER